MAISSPSVPPTVSAVNIQVFDNKVQSGAGLPSVSPGGYNTTGYGASPYGYAPPQQALQGAYTDAVTARNAAEAQRNAYLNMANQLNAMAYQQQMMNPANYYQPQYPMPYPTEPPPPEAPKVSPLKSATIEQLNQMMDKPGTLQERIDAMEEVAVRGFGTPRTYELLKREAMADTSQYEGQAREDAVYVRQAALWTLGMLNKAQNATMPTQDLPGIDVIEKILKNRKENPDVKIAAIQSWMVINRPNDAHMKRVLKPLAHSWWPGKREKDPAVLQRIQDALDGKSIPLPASATPAMAPGMPPMLA